MLRSVINIIKERKSIVFIIALQIFLMLLFNMQYFNRLKSYTGTYDELKDSPINNSVIFMGHFPYNYEDDNKSVNNYEDLLNNKKELYEYYKNNPDTFKSISPSTMTFSNYEANEDDEYRFLELYDKETIKFIKPYFKKDYDFTNYSYDEEIPVIVQEKFEKDFPIDSTTNINIEGSNRKLRVIGYYENKYPELMLTQTSTDNFSINEIINIRDSYYPKFITLKTTEIYNDDLLNKINPEGLVILYLSDNVSENNMDEFKSFVKENNLGYIHYSKDLFDEQIETNKNFIQDKLDMFMAFFTIVILSLITIGYINMDLLEKRYKIYYLNGASDLKLYFITFIYYFIISIFSLGLYQFFIYLNSIDFIKYRIFGNIPILHLLLRDDGKIYLKDYIIIIAIFIFVISIISYWPIYNIKRKRVKR